MIDTNKINPCLALIPGSALRKACDAAQAQADAAPPTSQGTSFWGIPIPGSGWQRHFMFRMGEVVVGIAMIVVGIKAFTNGSPTTKVIVQAAKKVN